MAYIEVDIDIDLHLDEASDRSLKQAYVDRFGVEEQLPTSLTLYEQETLDLVISKLRVINHEELQEFLKKY